LPNKDLRQEKTDVLQGTLDLMILHTVAAMNPLHGYAIAERLFQTSGGSIQLNMGTLYPALLRLEQRGFLRARWAVTDHNRRARFYSITSAGRKRLITEKSEWIKMIGIMQRVLETNP
jgi:PadR family transcriptional regulator PadR